MVPDLHILPLTDEEAVFLYKFLGGLQNSPHTKLFMRLSEIIDPDDVRVGLSPMAVMEFIDEKFYIGKHGLCYVGDNDENY